MTNKKLLKILLDNMIHTQELQAIQSAKNKAVREQNYQEAVQFRTLEGEIYEKILSTSELKTLRASLDA